MGYLFLYLDLSHPGGAAFEVQPRETQRRGGRGGVDSAELCRKRPRPSIETPAGNCSRGRRGEEEEEGGFTQSHTEISQAAGQ